MEAPEEPTTFLEGGKSTVVVPEPNCAKLTETGADTANVSVGGQLEP